MERLIPHTCHIVKVIDLCGLGLRICVMTQAINKGISKKEGDGMFDDAGEGCYIANNKHEKNRHTYVHINVRMYINGGLGHMISW